jgi:soluble cytochrome b562
VSVSPISSVDNTYQTYQANWQNNLSQVRQGFQTLASALQSGNLTDAQSAFAALQQLLPNFSAGSAGNQTQNGQSGSGQNQFATDFSALGQALQSGNVTQAQKAFATLQQDMQSVQGHHHHHRHHHGSASTQSTDSTTSNSSAQSTNGSGQNQFATDFSALGQALQNGDLSGAQAAFATLQQDMQSAAANFNVLV